MMIYMEPKGSHDTNPFTPNDAHPSLAQRPNTGWSATPLARLMAKIRAALAARLNPGR